MFKRNLIISFLILTTPLILFSNSIDSKFRYNWSNNQRIFKSKVELSNADVNTVSSIVKWLNINSEKYMLENISADKNKVIFTSTRRHKELGGYKFDFEMLMEIIESELRLKLTFNNAKTFRNFTYAPPKKRVDEVLKEMKSLKNTLINDLKNGNIPEEINDAKKTVEVPIIDNPIETEVQSSTFEAPEKTEEIDNPEESNSTPITTDAESLEDQDIDYEEENSETTETIDREEDQLKELSNDTIETSTEETSSEVNSEEMLIDSTAIETDSSETENNEASEDDGFTW